MYSVIQGKAEKAGNNSILIFFIIIMLHTFFFWVWAGFFRCGQDGDKNDYFIAGYRESRAESSYCPPVAYLNQVNGEMGFYLRRTLISYCNFVL